MEFSLGISPEVLLEVPPEASLGALPEVLLGVPVEGYSWNVSRKSCRSSFGSLFSMSLGSLS